MPFVKKMKTVINPGELHFLFTSRYLLTKAGLRKRKAKNFHPVDKKQRFQYVYMVRSSLVYEKDLSIP